MLKRRTGFELRNVGPRRQLRQLVQKVKQLARIIELDDRVTNLVFTEGKPFDFFAEGLISKTSGEGGIRTLGDVAATPVFETGPIGHSGTSPKTEYAPMIARRRHLYIARSLAATGGFRDWAQRPH